MKPETKEAIDALKAQISEDEKYTSDLNSASWHMQEGVLLTTNQAKEILKAIEDHRKAEYDEVDSFADSMRTELLANSTKGDWREFKDPQAIYYELGYHEKKLHNAVSENNLSAIKEHIADCANFLLMLGNAFGLYKPIPTPTPTYTINP